MTFRYIVRKYLDEILKSLMQRDVFSWNSFRECIFRYLSPSYAVMIFSVNYTKYRDLVTINFSTNEGGKYILDRRGTNSDESQRLKNMILDKMARCRGQVDLSRCRTKYHELQRQSRFKTGFLVMYSDAVQIKTGEVEVQRIHTQHTATNRHDLERCRTMQNEFKWPDKKSLSFATLCSTFENDIGYHNARPR